MKFLNEAEAGHKSYVTIDFVPSSVLLLRSGVWFTIQPTSSASCRSGSTYRPAHRPVLESVIATTPPNDDGQYGAYRQS